MLIIPAIDLKDGCVVRYVQGKLDKKVYSRDPVKTARHWAKQGAQMIHVVDLDGAFSGEPLNIGIVKEIAASVNVPIQFGGGVRKLETIKTLLDAKVARVILGTRAIEDDKFLKKTYKEFGDKIIISLDAKDDSLATQGWKETVKKIKVVNFALMLKEMGFKEVIYTDTLKDGTLKGPNILGIKNLLKATGLKVIASGGMSSLEDVRKLKILEKSGLVGVIIGKALYEGKFTCLEAIKLG
ncbi:MAG: 1-(5-phosphoribosyl)-5-[(5-phosphoribosylamino)methylideneamino]imidazole-4-carboxamide isomerase [Candidatus Omnitrophota bacterium]